MNTKNIFRTLFMAVLLLVGANGAKADKVLYDNPAGSGSYGTINIPFGALDDCHGGVMKITYDILPQGWTPDYQIQIGNVKTVSVTSGGVYEITLDDNFFGKVNTTDQYNNCTFITSIWTTIFKVEVIGGGGGGNAGPQTYTLTINVDGEITTKSVAAGTDLTSLLPTPTKPGYKFNGWSGLPADHKMPANDLTVTALFEEREHVTATIASTTGFATFCSDKVLDFSNVSGLKAYYATAINDGEVVFSQVRGAVAAGTGLLLYGETSNIFVADGTGTSYNDNLLVGVLNNSVTANSANQYVLVEKEGEAKFADTAGRAAAVPVGKAYLQAPASSRPLSFRFDDGTTAIGAVTTTAQQTSGIYNLKGQRVTTPGKGLYIINGKKVIIK